jgi:hypothetical protein
MTNDEGWKCQEFGLRPLRAVGSLYEPEAIGAGPTPRLPARRVQSLQLGEREVGMRTRRRPIGRDYAAAKDAENKKRHSARHSGRWAYVKRSAGRMHAI